ncbi:MAG: DUF1080 domain-containing protein [Thermoguttaceae bacterium]|jgi:hypothetical protein|nr:DUF1080 domain-containing protein [Thermoguttaceae bacterium]
MSRIASIVAGIGLVCCGLAVGCMAAEEIIDPEQAKADPDFAIQGEYVGEGTLFGESAAAVGAQVVALGQGEFHVYVLQGGLPGAGWKRGQTRIQLDAKRQGDEVAVTGQGFRGTIAGGKLSLTAEGKGKASLKRTERKSPTLGLKAPAGAKLLYGGPNEGKENWLPGHVSPLGYLLGDAETKEKFGEYRLHLEFMLSYMPRARGQGRSNSGVYIHDCYECQVLDSFGLTGENNECGGFYTLKAPDVNMCLPPLVWQTYDIEYTAPKYDGSGNKTANARVTVKHNGVTIHDRVELPKDCPGRKKEGPGPRALFLQGHGNKVQYRNIWIEEKH